MARVGLQRHISQQDQNLGFNEYNNAPSDSRKFKQLIKTKLFGLNFKA